MQRLTITTPDDWHLHFRDEAMLEETVPATARCFRRAIVMPNLVPPVVNAEQALAYKERIMANVGISPILSLWSLCISLIQLLQMIFAKPKPLVLWHPSSIQQGLQLTRMRQ